jgi:hypothetical protein
MMVVPAVPPGTLDAAIPAAWLPVTRQFSMLISMTTAEIGAILALNPEKVLLEAMLSRMVTRALPT